MRRRHVVATALLAVFVAVASGVVVAAVASARRADTSIARFTASGRTFDATVFSCPAGVDPNGLESQYEVSTTCLSAERAGAATAELARLPGVEAVDVGGYFVVGVLDRRSPNGWGGVTLLAATMGSRDSLVAGAPRLLAGRLPDPQADDEVVVSERAAAAHRLRPGDRLRLGSWPMDRLDEAVNGGLAPDPAGALTLRVVGVGRFASDLSDGEAPDVSGRYYRGELQTAGASGRALAGFANYGIAPIVRLRAGPAGVDALRAELGRRWGDRFFSIEASETTMGASRSSEQRVDTERQAVLAFAVIVAVATAGFAGLTLFRQLRSEQPDVRLLRQLGMTRRELVAGGLLRAVAVAVPAAVLTVAVAVALSPLGPVGLARRAEPDPGVHADWAVLWAGAAVVLLAVLAVAPLATVLGLRPARPVRPSGGHLADLSAALGAAPRVGLSFVRGSWPRIAAAVTAAAVAALVTAGMAVASLDRVLDAPARYGAWWDADLGDFSEPDALAAGADVVAADPDVAVVAAFTEQSDVATLDRQPVTLAAYQAVKGRPAPVVTRGRPPVADDEVVLGTTVLRRLGAHVGGTVRLDSARGAGGVADRRLTVVGVALFLNPVTTTEGLGDGGFVTPALLDELSPGVPQRLLARLAPGADRRAVIDRLAHRFAGPIRNVAPPDDVRNMAHLRSLPWLLGTLVAALAAVTLAHALIVTVRQRRRDLAVLRVMGATRWGARRVTAFATLAIVVLAGAAGIPGGLVGGRALWVRLAGAAGLASGPVRGWQAPVAVTLAMLAGAQVVTLAATRRLTAAAPAAVLRSE